MVRRMFQDLPAEAVSEETFSTHANTETKKRLNLDPDLVSDLVFCNKNASTSSASAPRSGRCMICSIVMNSGA